MNVDGFEYVKPADLPPDWLARVDICTATVDASLEKSRLTANLEAINSDRLQLKFPRGLDALPPAVRNVVEVLHARLVTTCGDELQSFVLQDCYALYTPPEEISAEARAPQRWHLDAIKRFPVAALLLRGARATEFGVGSYSDLSAGISARTLEEWTASLKLINAKTWEAESEAEWMHFSQHLHAASLVTGEDNETGVGECDWSKLRVAPTPEATAGSASIFWSNKVHRGPGTELGEERLVLFCSWLPAATKGKKKESETDYSFYDGHLEPKLRLSARARRDLARDSKRQRR